MNICSGNSLDHHMIMNIQFQPPQHDDIHHHRTPTGTSVGLATLDRNDLSDWVDQITKHLIDEDEDEDEDNLVISTADLRPRKIPRKNPQCINNDHDNISNTINPNNNNINYINISHGLNLMTLLFEAAVAISVDNLGGAHRILMELAETASPHAPSCGERVVAYFAQAMTCRVVSSGLGIYNPATVAEPWMLNYQNRLVHVAFQAYNAVSPFVKFAHFTSNQAILEALQGLPRVHIVDLDAMQGLQWPALFHLLATRPEGPPHHVRLSAVGPAPEILSRTGKHLAGFAKRLGLSFEFSPVAAATLADVDASAFKLRRGEALAVHWLYDAAGSDRRAMCLVEELRPRLFTLVEPDLVLYGGGGSFLDRFVGSLHFYSAVFDSLGASAAAEDGNRHAAEQGMVWREISNVLAVGGPARTGEEKFASWRRELAAGGGGFAQVAMSGSAVAQARLIVNMAAGGGGGEGYSMGEGEGCIRVGWKGTSLYTASAWTCTNYYNDIVSTVDY